MNNNIEYLLLFLTSLLGITIHLLTKAEAIKSRNDAAGLSGRPFKELFQKDYISIIKAVVLNGALLIFYAFAKSKWTEIDFMVGLIGFLFSGYTGSSFVLSLFSKVDKLQKEKINNISILTPNTMEEYIWETEFKNLTDMVAYQSTDYDLPSFAEASAGVLNGKIVSYESEPDYVSLTVTKLDTTTYLAAPIRKPKIN